MNNMQFTKQELIAISNALNEHIQEIDKFVYTRKDEIEFLKAIYKKVNSLEKSISPTPQKSYTPEEG